MNRIKTICTALLCAIALTATAASAEVVGTAESTLSQIGALQSQCDLGNATADAVRKACGADVAILPGELLYMNLPSGEITSDQLEQSYSGNPELGVCTVTPARLKELLEVGFGQIVIGEGDRIAEDASDFAGYPQLSGMTVKADYSALPGDRVLTITLEDGTALDLEDNVTQLTLASTMELLSGGYGYPAQESAGGTGTTLLACISQALAEGTLSAPAKSRLKVIGIQGNIYLQNVSPWLLVVFMVIILAIGAISSSVKRPRSKYKGDQYDEV